jgi:HSP20 family protein
MWTRWGEFDRSFEVLEDFRRRMDRLFDGYGVEGAPTSGHGPRMAFRDEGSALVLSAELPGLAEGDVKLTVNQDVLTLEGERRVQVPEGYAAHRQERGPMRFSRSFTLPCKVDAEHTQASLRDGVLKVTLPKAPEARPRQIAVNGA